tara:strand:- start:374 stop:1414 length:1041 start_codon:yes stop_codon:yes gene_type:complete
MTLVIHMGTGKTGTTYLQDIVFPELCKKKGIEFNPPIFSKLFWLLGPESYEEYKNNLNYLEDNKFLEYKKDLETYIKNKKIFLSLESFCSLGYQLDVTFSKKLLAYFIPSFKAVIVLRKHSDFLYSLYRQTILQGNIVEYDKFLSYKKVNYSYAFNQRFNFKNPKINISELSYKKIIEDIEDLKNCKGVFIYNYDDFNLSNRAFINSVFTIVLKTKLDKNDCSLLARLLRIPRKNVSIDIDVIDLILKLNRITPFDKFMLYSSDTYLNKKRINSFLAIFYKNIPSFILRIFTWRTIRKILKSSFLKKIIPSSKLKFKIYNHINNFSELYKRDQIYVSKKFVNIKDY